MSNVPFFPLIRFLIAAMWGPSVRVSPPRRLTRGDRFSKSPFKYVIVFPPASPLNVQALHDPCMTTNGFFSFILDPERRRFASYCQLVALRPFVSLAAFFFGRESTPFFPPVLKLPVGGRVPFPHTSSTGRRVGLRSLFFEVPGTVHRFYLLPYLRSPLFCSRTES